MSNVMAPKSTLLVVRRLVDQIRLEMLPRYRVYTLLYKID